MKRYTQFWIIISLFGLSGCEFGDKIKDKAEVVYEQAKHKYEEYREGKENVPKPFTVIYQDNPNDKTTIVSSSCTNNSPVTHVYYQTPADTNRVLYETQNLISYPGKTQKPFWDIRYTDPVNAYMNGGNYYYYPDHGRFTGLDVRSGVRNLGIGTEASKNEAGGGIAQSKCVNGVLVGGTTINLFNAPEQYIHYGGPQSTFTYQLGDTSLSYPWKADGTGNLALQAIFDTPLYFNYEANLGGGIYFSLFLKNKHNGKVLNYIIGIYATGDAWLKEKRGIKFDPTTQFVHVATVISDDSWWSTKSPSSKPITEIFPSQNIETSDDGQWNEFFRVNVSYQNLQVLLQELAETPPAGAENQNFGLKPEDWRVTGVMIQYELEEEGGEATFSGSFQGFEAYLSHYPI